MLYRDNIVLIFKHKKNLYFSKKAGKKKIQVFTLVFIQVRMRN